MSGDINAEHLLLARELLLWSPIRKVRKRLLGVGRFILNHTEQASLATLPVLPHPLPGFHRAFDHGEQLRAIAREAVQCPGLDQAFNDPAIDRAKVDSFAKVEQRFERAI